ncbi:MULTISPECIES: non-ribosomal peptide synthetase [unclassified Nostoc]|uniref:non-ribosomal peptide synthetase n=1 Tax=unclassified Nostoc TaxID=2593658 RepID=UPI002AD44436|nr:non-ribosomal peptide synthetase [Nostoc sp. DedQUE03]MDZ7972184.1 amino acid adenylation domain-containing protein [Nostoc sp. DedQUE03]MDZ8047175.1 amino acid adenylation domain-containing protein [Nostoc sp. DedQUE02]
MNIEQLVANLNKQGVKFWVEGEQLRVNAPKGVLTLETRNLLAQNKSELILFLQEKKAATNTDLPLVKAKRPQNIPLSFAQERLWLLNQLEPDSPFYNEQTALKFHGQLNVAALEQSLNKIIARHEVLRTNFRTINEQPVQVIADSLTLSVLVVDLTELPESEKAIACQKLATTELAQPFDLASSALIRACVVKSTELEHAFILTVHHIIVDGWSTGILMRELATIYSAICNNLSPKLPELSIQYADFAIWQRQWLQKEVLQTQLDYWRQQLKNAPTLLELPTDRPRPAIQTYRGAVQYVELSSELSQAIANFSRQEGASLFMTLFCAYVTLLYRYTSSDDIVVGTPIANRDRLELEGLIGFFVNTLVLRTDLSGNPSFKELLGRVRQRILQAYTHADFPFDELVKALQPQRDLSYTPLFQVLFVLQNAPISEVELPGLTISPLPTQSTVAKFDLTLSFQNTATGLVSMWQYNADLFDAATIERMSGHFVTLLKGIIANPKEQISQLPLLTAVEQQQLLVEWNNTQVDYPTDKCIHQLFEEQVERTPDAIAVIFENQQLTYQQLNCRANQLAHYLRSLGVKPDTLVGICVERSLDIVVGLLAILKAGGAYLPLDPDYPPERLSFMLEDAQVSVLLTQHSLIEKLPQYQAEQVLLDTNWLNIGKYSQENPITSVQATNLAYVIYTSGSTGRPKGVMISHSAIANHCYIVQQTYKFVQSDRLLQFVSISFDPSLEDIFHTLMVGATLVLRGSDVWTPTNCQKIISDFGITVLSLPTAYWHQLAQEHFQTQVLDPNNQLRLALVGGDVMLPEYVALWQQSQMSCVRLINIYGPTETTIGATLFETLPQVSEDINLKKIPIGRPLPNKTVYILDKYLQPVPIGVPGELYIGGACLAKGYLNCPELTQEKFIPNPFQRGRGAEGQRGRGEDFPSAPLLPCSPAYSEHLYKTGDLARYLPDGNIEYLGRIDNQVKIRGFRMELGEIETVLSQHQDVQASCVIAREDTPGDKRLVAYVVPHQHCTNILNQLRDFLKAKLPEYMVPNAIAILDSLPLTPNGKIDRRALPAPDLQSKLSDKYFAPRNPVEEMLAQIWAQILKLEQVGIHDNFFELGGHSLLATQLLSRIRNIFKVELPLRELFARATIAELGHFIGQLQQQELEISTPPILRRTNNTQLPLSYAQQRLWFLDQLQPLGGAYNMPLTLRLVGTLNQTALEQSLEEIIRRHEVLRTNFINVDGQPFQVIREQGTGSREQGILSIVDLQHLPTSEQEIALQQLVQQQAQQPFNLADEPLIRATLVLLSQTKQALLVFIHHIVSDGWSIGVFTQELAALYNAYTQDQLSLLAPLLIQYADFAIWQRQWLQGDVLQGQLSYWQQQLKDAPTLLSLPTDRPRGAVQTYHGAYQELVISKELSTALKNLSQKESVTLFMTLLAVFQILLWRYSGQDDICIGTPIANRNRAEIESLIGFFINTLVMRTRLDGNPSFRELLSRVREVALGAYTHQDLPFEMLVEALQPERNLSHNPIFQVWFNLQNLAQNELELFGLSVEPILMSEAASKFDLSLYVAEYEQGITLQLLYNADLFTSERMVEMVQQFHHLLNQIVVDADSNIASYSLVTPQAQLLLPDPTTAIPQPEYELVTTTFTSWVNSAPELSAVRQGSRTWNYGELGNKSQALARVMLSHGIAKGDVVAVYGSPSFGLIASAIAVLLSGGVLLTIDPQLPSQRQRLMLQEAKAKFILYVDSQYLEDQIWQSLTVICINPDTAEAINSLESSHTIPLPEISANDAAYIFFTSGTTGVPKGVLGCHKGMAHFLNWQRQTFEINQQDRIAQLTGLSFDVVLRDIFLPLTSGATLCLPAPEDKLEPTKILRYLEREQISVLHTVPSLAQSWLANVPSKVSLHNLRWLFLAGEPLKETLVLQWRNAFPEAGEIVNLYGPTETTLAKCYYQVPSEPRPGIQPVGRTLPETQALVLGRNHQLSGIGEPGEIVLRTPFRSLGYINASQEMRSLFVINHFRNDEQDLLYYTGDRGCYFPDGTLEILGRQDYQVKIRGIRIELGEIETVLAQHPSVHQTVVAAREDESDEQRLVAYIIPTPESTPTISEIRRFLSTKLPQYMVPSSFVFLNRLPLTPNGKVDRRALPIPSNVNHLDTFIEPRNQLELQLVQIWSKILKVDKVGVQDNFFDLGGHSLLAPYLMAQIKQQFGKDVSLTSLFQNPTIEQLATILQIDSDYESSSCLVPIQPNGSKLPFFCLPGAGGEPFYLYHLGRYLGEDQPLYSFQANNLDGLETATRIKEMANHYIQAMQTVQPQGPYFLGGHSLGSIVAFEMATQLVYQGHQVALLAMIDMPAPTSKDKQTRIERLDWDHARWLVEAIKAVEVSLSTNIDISYDTLRSLSVEEQLKRVLQHFKTVNMLPPNAEITQLKNIVQALKANSLSLIKYEPQHTYPGQITLLRASETPPERLNSKFSDISQDSAMGWEEYSCEPVDIHFVPGNHVTMLAEPHVQILAERLKVCIQQALYRQGGKINILSE